MVTNKEPNKEPSGPSSSDLNIKETTTTQLDDEWNFDSTPYARFGFTYSQIKQLAKVGVSASDVEQSLRGRVEQVTKSRISDFSHKITN